MGKEFEARNLIEDEDDGESEKSSDVDMDDEEWRSKRIEQLFPVRPVRVRHEDVETVKEKYKKLFQKSQLVNHPQCEDRACRNRITILFGRKRKASQ